MMNPTTQSSWSLQRAPQGPCASCAPTRSVRRRQRGQEQLCAAVPQQPVGPAVPPVPPKRTRKPEWVRILEEDADVDEDVARLLEGADGDADTIRERMKNELMRKDMFSEGFGSERPPRISFREVNPFNLWVWFEFLNGPPTRRELDLLQALLQAWFMLGKMGGYNSQNMQVFYNAGDDQSFFDYDNDQVVASQGSLLHDMSELELKGSWARCRIDLGSCDELALDALLNSVVGFSKDVVALSRVVVGGQNRRWPVPDDPHQQEQEDARFDIDPMQLPEGLDEELELLDALEEQGVLRRRPGGEQQDGDGAEEADVTVASSKARRRAKGRAGEDGPPMTLEGLDELLKQEDQLQQRGGDGDDEAAAEQQQQRAWGSSFMRKYSTDEFKRVFRSQ